MKKCKQCGVLKPLSEYNKRSQNKDGLNTKCRQCTKANAKKHYHTNPSRKLTIMNRTKENCDKKKDYILNYLNIHPCAKCGESDIRCLEFNHLKNKEHNIADMLRNNRSLLAIQSEIDKCEVLCANCHAKHSHEQWNSYRHKYLNK